MKTPIEAPRAATTTTSEIPTWRMWAALVAMMFSSFALVTAEFLPGGMVTLIAEDLGVSDGTAGQMVTVTAAVGFVAALSIGAVSAKLDRRLLLVIMAVTGAVSNVAVAIAPSMFWVLTSRFLLGVALSGFWAMSLTVAAKIGGVERVARSMTFVTLGVAAANVFGIPLGVLVSAAFDWRTVFMAVAGLTAVVAVALWFLLPSVPPEPGIGFNSLVQTARALGMPAGLTGHVAVVFASTAAYAYVRVALEQIPGVGAADIARLLVVFGLAGLLGNFAIGMIADRWLSILRFAVPGAIGTAVLMLAIWPGSLVAVHLAMAMWGAAFSSWLIVLNTWLARQVPGRLEAGGGLVVAGFQLAIGLGAAAGGWVVDSWGIKADLLVAAVLAYVGMVLFGTARSAPSDTARTAPSDMTRSRN